MDNHAGTRVDPLARMSSKGERRRHQLDRRQRLTRAGLRRERQAGVSYVALTCSCGGRLGLMMDVVPTKHPNAGEILGDDAWLLDRPGIHFRAETRPSSGVLVAGRYAFPTEHFDHDTAHADLSHPRPESITVAHLERDPDLEISVTSALRRLSLTRGGLNIDAWLATHLSDNAATDTRLIESMHLLPQEQPHRSFVFSAYEGPRVFEARCRRSSCSERFDVPTLLAAMRDAVTRDKDSWTIVAGRTQGV